MIIETAGGASGSAFMIWFYGICTVCTVLTFLITMCILDRFKKRVNFLQEVIPELLGDAIFTKEGDKIASIPEDWEIGFYELDNAAFNESDETVYVLTVKNPEGGGGK